MQTKSVILLLLLVAICPNTSLAQGRTPPASLAKAIAQYRSFKNFGLAFEAIAAEAPDSERKKLIEYLNTKAKHSDEMPAASLHGSTIRLKSGTAIVTLQLSLSEPNQVSIGGKTVSLSKKHIREGIETLEEALRSSERSNKSSMLLIILPEAKASYKLIFGAGAVAVAAFLAWMESDRAATNQKYQDAGLQLNRALEKCNQIKSNPRAFESNVADGQLVELEKSLQNIHSGHCRSNLGHNAAQLCSTTSELTACVGEVKTKNGAQKLTWDQVVFHVERGVQKLPTYLIEPSPGRPQPIAPSAARP